MATKLINVTPHDLNFYDRQPADGGKVIAVLPKEDPEKILRVGGKVENLGNITVSIDGMELEMPKFHTQDPQLIGELPELQDDVIYVASLPAAKAAKAAGCNDVVSPGEAVRDAENRQIGCIGLMFP